MTIINGKVIASEIKEKIKLEVKELASKNIIPHLAIILVGNNPSSKIYVRNKAKLSDELGTRTTIHKFDELITEEELITTIHKLNNDQSIHGILVQLPLPKHINEEHILNKINPNKDVDCFTLINTGKLWTAKKHQVNLKPCTPAAIITSLKHHNITTAGKHVVIIGRSNIVGKPVGALSLLEDATVTFCHSKTTNLKEICKTADILIVAIGSKKFVNHEFIKENAIVIDVGINRDENNHVVGDVDFDDVKDIVSYITPVPGGIGPLTVMQLMQNLIILAKINNSK